MVINIALWTDPGLFGVFGSNDLRNTWSNPFINTFVKLGRHAGMKLDCLPMARCSRPSSASCWSSAPCTTSSRSAASWTPRGRGRRRDRRGRHRLTGARGHAPRPGRGGGSPSPRPRMTGDGGAMTRVRRDVLHGELRDELVHAMQRVPGARRPRADAGPAVGRHHEPQLPGGRGDGQRRAVRDPPRRQRHPPAGDQPRGGARGDGRRGRRRGGRRGRSRSCAPRATS